MAEPTTDLPNQAGPISMQQLREALAFVSDKYQDMADGSKNVFAWFWEAVQGDFNQERSTGQVVFDTAISMIPGVDQVCDVRDIIANCKQINDDKSNNWAWVGLVLTLIGLFPTLGSLVKGVLKIFFLFVRRYGLNHIVKAVDEAMTWVITLLRRREVAKYWKHLRWDRLFGELANQVRSVRDMINPSALSQAFDRAISLMRNLLGEVASLPWIGSRAQACVDMVVSIRNVADKHLGKALKPVQDIMDAIIHRLQIEDLIQRRGVVDAGNVHFSGTLPEAHAVTLMKRVEPKPSWLSEGAEGKNTPLIASEERQRVNKRATQDYPDLNNDQIASFAKGMRPDVLKGPMRLYRVVSPSNLAANADWMTEEMFNKLKQASEPRSAWRKFFAVWPNWNPNGQFVIYELKAGEQLKVWRGPTSSQTLDNLDDYHLEGGYEQIKFDARIDYAPDGSIPRDAAGKPILSLQDKMEFYQVDEVTGATRPSTMTYARWKDLPAHEQVKYASLRQEITNPRIIGPFDTGWGSIDFGTQINDVKLGLPNLPGQKINR